MARALTIQDSMDDFIKELQVGHSPETARTYLTALTCLGDYLRQAHLDARKHALTTLQPRHLLDYPVWLTGERWRNKPKTSATATYLAAVQSWLKYVAREKLHPELAAEMERIREAYREIRRGRQRKLPRTLQPHESEKLLAEVRKQPKVEQPRLLVVWRRDWALTEALRSTGARISELLGGNVEDLQVRQKALRVMGKGSRERLVFFDRRAWDAMKSYLDARKALKLVSKGQTTSLFAQHSRKAGKALKRLTPTGARIALWQYVKRAGIQSRITPHKWRHTFATAVLEKTGDLAATQDLLGHASPATTRIYAKLTTTRLRKIHEEVFPG